MSSLRVLTSGPKPSEWSPGGADEAANRLSQLGRPPVWVDCEPGELRSLQPVFGLHDLAVEDCRNQNQRPKLEDYGDHRFVVFNRVDYEPGARRGASRSLRAHELDVFFGRDFLITVHREPFPEIDSVWAAALRGPAGGVSPGNLLHRILDAIVDGYFPLLDRLEAELDAAEEVVLRRPSRDPLSAIFHLRRQALVLRRLLGPQRDVLLALARSELDGISPGDRAYLQNVYDHSLRVFDRGEIFREMVGHLLEAHLTVVGNRTNDTMRTLTAISIIFMPLTLLAGIWGMNFRFMPELEQPWGYPAAWATMLLLGGALFLWLRRRGWL